MNIKLNNDENPSTDDLESAPYTSSEERRRTGRYIAIVVGISLVCLAMYHAWVRNVPVLASLLVPALIMLLYIGWVLYTASKDKKRELDLEAELEGISAAPAQEVIATTPEVAPKQVTLKVSHSSVNPKRFKRSFSIA